MCKIKLSDTSIFNLEKINKNDLLIITSCSIPSSRHNFKINNRKSYDQLLLSFDKKVLLFEDIHIGGSIRSYDNLFLDLENLKDFFTEANFSDSSLVTFFDLLNDCLMYN